MEESNNPLVVVVDDNKNDLLMAKFLIQREGCDIHLIDNQADLIPYLKSNEVAMILLDVEMPGLSGIDMLKRIKRESSLKSIPVLMLTGDSSLDTVKSAIVTGASDFITKPIDPMIFEQKLNKYLKKENAVNKQEWVEYQLSKIFNSDVNLQISGKIVSVGELSITLLVKNNVGEGTTFFLETTLFNDIGIKSIPLKVESCFKTDQDDFHLKCSIIGLNLADLQRIRVFCTSLWRNK